MVNRTLTERDRANAHRLRNIWNVRKDELGLSQESAAKMLGWTQSAVSQYLNSHIALNTDAVIAFASLLNCSVRDIDPGLAKFSDAHITLQGTTPVTHSLTSLRLNPESGSSVAHIATSPAQFAIRIATTVYEPYFREGHFLIIDPNEKINSGDFALARYNDQVHIATSVNGQLFHIKTNQHITDHIIQEPPLKIIAVTFTGAT